MTEIQRQKGLIIIPTYNERENIVRIIPEVFKESLPLDVLVVDDNSPDHTANFVKDMQKENSRIFLMEREGKGLSLIHI